MQPLLIHVDCYAGYQADESPRRFFFEERGVAVKEIVDRWYQGAGDPEWPIADYFKVTGDDGCAYLLKHDREVDSWYLCRKWQGDVSP